MTREALKLALEALEKSHICPLLPDDCAEAITAIKEALSSCQCPECKVLLHASDCAVHNEPAYPKGECNCGAQPEQEPVAWATRMGEYAHIKWGAKRPEYPIVYEIPLYTTPPQRQPLTDEELFKLWDEDVSCDMPDTFTQFKHTARAIEAAHGIKGEA